MAVVEAGLSGGDIDLCGTDCAVGEDGDTLGKHLNETATDAVGLFPGLTAVKADLSGTKDSDERGVSVEDFKITVARRNLDGIRGLVDEDAIRGDEPNL